MQICVYTAYYKYVYKLHTTNSCPSRLCEDGLGSRNVASLIVIVGTIPT